MYESRTATSESRSLTLAFDRKLEWATLMDASVVAKEAIGVKSVRIRAAVEPAVPAVERIATRVIDVESLVIGRVIVPNPRTGGRETEDAKVGTGAGAASMIAAISISAVVAAAIMTEEHRKSASSALAMP